MKMDDAPVEMLEKKTCKCKGNCSKAKENKEEPLLEVFNVLCDKLTLALRLTGVSKIKYSYLIPEIFYYAIKLVLGIINFVNTNESLTNLLYVMNNTKSDTKKILIRELRARNKKQE